MTTPGETRSLRDEGDLLTVREVAALLRLKPDTLYRWAREGRLPAIKLGKEWRVHLADIEKLIGRPAARRAEADVAVEEPAASTHAGLASSAIAARPRITGPASPQTIENLERGLQSFIGPRDHVLVIAVDENSLHPVQAAFWRMAALAGDRLVVLRPSERIDATVSRLADAGVGNGEDNQVVAVSNHDAAREHVSTTAHEEDRGLWADYGIVDEITDSHEEAENHARAHASSAVTHDVVSLTAVLSEAWEDRPFDARVRLQAAHRGMIQAAGDDVLFSRPS